MQKQFCCVSAHKFRHFTRRLGIDRNAVDEFFNGVNIDGSGLIATTEFLAFFRNNQQAISKDEFDALLPKIDHGMSLARRNSG